MKYPVKIEYELVISGNRGLNSDCKNFVTAVEVNSGCFARSSIVEYPLTVELIRELKEEAKEAVLAKVQVYAKTKERALLEAQILATEEFELEI